MNKKQAIWSEDVFELHHVQYSDEEIELAREKIVSLFSESDEDFPERSLPQKQVE